jgi:N-methylhydantoinase B/oxoprolinase/acetone carboxylase alpha subunit
MNGAPRPGGWLPPQDIKRNSREGQQLLADFRASESARQRRHTRLMEMFREQDARIKSIKDAEYVAAMERQQTIANEPVEAPPVIDAAYTSEALPPPAEVITDADHLAWRQTVIHTDRGILG